MNLWGRWHVFCDTYEQRTGGKSGPVALLQVIDEKMHKEQEALSAGGERKNIPGLSQRPCAASVRLGIALPDEKVFSTKQC